MSIKHILYSLNFKGLVASHGRSKWCGNIKCCRTRFEFDDKHFYPTLTLKTAAFVTCWAVKKWGNARPYTKSKKKVRKSVVKIEKKPHLGVIVWKRKKPSPFLSSVECSHKIKMKYSDKGTLVQRQRYPLPSRTLQYWPMNHRERNTISRHSVFENIFDNCFVIIGNGEINHYHSNTCTFNFKEPQ